MKNIIPKSLKVKGPLSLPRYAWLIILIGMAAVVIYIRYRNEADEEIETDTTGEPEIMGDIGMGGDYLYSGADYSNSWIPDTGLTLMPSSGVISRPVTIGADPIAPDVINVVINANTDNTGKNNRPCTKPKPTQKPKKGFHWVCANGQWTQRANIAKPKPKPGKNKCGKRPARKPKKGFHWACKNKKWVQVKNNTKKRALMDDGPLMAYSQAPFRRDNHRQDKAPTNRPMNRLRNG